MALSLLALAVPLALGAAHVAVTMRDRFFNVGDVALMELATRSAASGDQLLGPYSRFGWHHPGPALFYLYAPFLQLSGGSSRAPFLAALTLNLVCGLIVVVVVRRHLGEVPARAAAAALLLGLVLLTPDRLLHPWNPRVVTSLVLLALVLLALGARGSAATYLWGLVVASVVVQSHVSAAPALVLAAAAMLVPLLRSDPGRVLGSGAALAAAVALVAVWGPTAIEQVTSSDGNVTALVRWFRESSGDHSLTEAWRAVARHASLLPLGLDRAWNASYEAPLRSAVLLATLLAGAAIAVGARRRQPFASTLALLAVGSLVIAVLSATRVEGPLESYLLEWTAAPAVAIWIAAAVVAASPPRLPVGRVTVVTLPVLGVLLAAALLRDAEPYPSATHVAALVRDCEARMEASGTDAAMVGTDKGAAWPDAVGLVLALSQDGHDSRLDEPWERAFDVNHGTLTRPASCTVTASGEVGSTPTLGPGGE